MIGVLVSPAELAARADAIEVATRGLVAAYRAEYGTDPAFRRFLLFSSAEALEAVGLHELGELGAFYNQYFWFKRFVKQHTAHAGPDAGLEQQVFQLLESAPPGVDWSILEALDHEVEAS